MDGTFNIRVYGLCVREGYILLSDEVFQGIEMTKFPGGGLEYGEGTVACLYREFEEEHIGSVRSLSHYYTTDFFSSRPVFRKNPAAEYLLFGGFGATGRLSCVQQGSILSWFWRSATPLGPLARAEGGRYDLSHRSESCGIVEVRRCFVALDLLCSQHQGCAVGQQGTTFKISKKLQGPKAIFQEEFLQVLFSQRIQ